LSTLIKSNIQAIDALVQEFSKIVESRRNSASKSSYYRVFGKTIELEFLDPSIEQHIHPTLAHLETGATRDPWASLTCWDTNGSPGAFPSVNVGTDGFKARSEAPGLSDDFRLTSFVSAGRILSHIDLRTLRGFHCVDDFSNMWRHEHATPLRTVFSWIAQTCGVQFLHVGAVGTEAGGILLSGRGGAGKSNTVLSVIGTELRVIGDDFCAVDVLNENPFVHSLYATGSLRRSDHSRNPILSTLPVLVDTGDDAKLVHGLQAGGHMLSGAPIRAIAHLRRSDAPFGLHNASAGQIALDLASDTQTMLPYSGQVLVAQTAKLARCVPCYILELGTDASAIAQGLNAIVRKANDGDLP
jgi:hypothetical protein